MVTFAPYLRQPFGRLDHLGSGDDRGEIAVEHFEVHAVRRHSVGGEERLELIELGFGQRFIEGAMVGHGTLSSELRVATPNDPLWGSVAQPGTECTPCRGGSSQRVDHVERGREY